jgi:hypothetical protein
MKRHFRRYFDGTRADHCGEFGSTVYDCIWYDRKTGKPVMRYDAADPANTQVDYDDAFVMWRKGVDLNEMLESDDGCTVRRGEEDAYHKEWCKAFYGE